MRLLLDESVPRRLGTFFPAAYEVHTVPRMGWAGIGNGALLRLAADRRRPYGFACTSSMLTPSGAAR